MTRQHIIDVATQLFARDGYDATSIEAVLRATELSRGALYHHFPGKEALFSAVLDALEARIAQKIADAAAEATSPLEALRLGCAAFITIASSDDAVRQIVLRDAPAAIGWSAWRAIEERYGLGLLQAAFARAADAELIDANDVLPYAHLVLATLIESALLVSRAPSPATMSAHAVATVDRILNALLVR